jgi:glutamyl-tRNA reductase
MNLFCVGLSHHTANVETRERFAGHPETDCILRSAGCAEALLLTTCNRVEVYGASEKRVSTDEITRCLVRGVGSLSAGTDHHQNQAPPFYRYEGAKCVQHLFRVASGLDSMVVGETEVLGQTKKAYERARASGGAGPYLHRLFQRAFRVAKHVRTHTEITRGSVSVGSVAVDLAQRIFGQLSNCKVLLLGAGETSERTARALVSRGVTDLRVSNRSIDRAHDLARLVGGDPIPFDEWPEQCREIDILITSTSSETPLLTPENLAPMLRARVDRPLFIIDIAVPRDVGPAVNELEGVYLYDIDSLQSVAEQSLALRRQQIAAAEAIIAEHVADFVDSMLRGLNRASQPSEHPSVGDTSLRTSEL